MKVYERYDDIPEASRKWFYQGQDGKWHDIDRDPPKNGMDRDLGKVERCDCAYNQTCHIPRQWLRIKFRNEGHEYSIEECPFYQRITEYHAHKVNE